MGILEPQGAPDDCDDTHNEINFEEGKYIHLSDGSQRQVLFKKRQCQGLELDSIDGSQVRYLH